MRRAIYLCVSALSWCWFSSPLLLLVAAADRVRPASLLRS